MVSLNEVRLFQLLTVSSSGSLLRRRAEEASSQTGGKRRRDDEEEQTSTNEAGFVTLKIPPNLQPRLSEILANKTRIELPVSKAPEDTIVISSRPGSNHRQSAPASLPRPGHAAILPRGLKLFSRRPTLISSTPRPLSGPVTTEDPDTDSVKLSTSDSLTIKQR